MPIGNGGIIGPANVPTITTASGVWSLREQQQAQGRGAWPLAIATDPYYEYTTLLLPGNGTNGANNNTFLDGSTNNFTITRNGNTTQGTFSPFSQTGWGVYFPSLTVTNQQKLIGTLSSQLGNGNFTLEFGIYLTGYRTTAGSVGTILDQSTGLGFNINELGRLILFERTGGATIIAPSSSTQVPTNIWTWVTLTRSGNAFTLYFNGSSVATGSSSLSFTETTINIGGRYAAGGAGEWNGFQGYLSNFRFSNTVRSASTPTTPLTSDANTLFLGLQSNRFINSATSAALTVGGNPSVQAFSPFNPTASWSSATYGGSGYFDGSGDWINPNTTSANLALGSGDFTIEFWVYTPRGATRQYICDFRNNGSTGTISPLTAPALIWGDNGADTDGNWFRYLASSNGSVVANADLLGVTLSTLSNQWNHIAVVRSSGTVYGYLNGVRKNSVADSTNYNVNCSVSVASFANGIVSLYLGYISNFRVVKGTAVYTGTTYTVPTAPLTAITNTSLLLNFTNAGIYDATSKNDLETVGNAQISTTQSKWGGSSISFDGTGDWLLIPDQPPQRIGTGNFTVEMWVYRNSSGTYGLAGKGTSTTGWLVSLNSSNQVVFTYGSSTITSTGTVSATTWTHIAVVREGTSTNQTKIYINGTNDGTGTVSTDFNQTNSMYIGADRTGGSAANAYVQDVRITNYARYTANFTAPTAAFPTL